MSRLLSLALLVSGLAVTLPRSAHAVCSTNALHKAWGPYWVERNTTGHCLIYARQYSCALSGGFRTETAATLLATVTGGTPSTSCESVAGFDAAIASIASRYAPSTFPTDGYQCDTTFVDNDQDGTVHR